MSLYSKKDDSKIKDDENTVTTQMMHVCVIIETAFSAILLAFSLSILYRKIKDMYGISCSSIKKNVISKNN